MGKSGQTLDPKANTGLCTDVSIVANTSRVKQVIITKNCGMSAVILLKRRTAVVPNRIEIGEQAEWVEPQKHSQDENNTACQELRGLSH